MEQAFALPRSAIVRPAVHLVLAVALGYGLIYFLRPQRSLSELPIVILLVLVAGAWYAAKYKYVRVSHVGLRGRAGSAGFKAHAISWSEPLSAKGTFLPGLSGHTFTSGATGAAIFIPLPILRSAEFKAAVAQHAPPSHVLRATEF